MMNQKKGFRLVALVIFAMTLSWLSGFLEPTKPRGVQAPKQDAYDYRLMNLKTNKLNRNGELAYTLNADSLTHFPVRKISHLEKPVLIQYSSADGRTETTANKAMLADTDKIIEMQGNVVTVQRNLTGKTIARSTSDKLTIQLQ